MCICIQVFMWTYVSDSLEYTPSRGIAVSWSFVTTFKLVAGHTVSQGCHLLRWAHRISDRPVLAIPASSPVTSQALCIPANGALCRPCVLLCCSSSLGFCSCFSLPFSLPLCPNASIFHTPTQLSPPLVQPFPTSLPTARAYLSFCRVGVGLYFVHYAPSFQLQGESPRAASLVLYSRASSR